MRAVKDLITRIARALVDDPDQVSVKETKGVHTSLYKLSVSKADTGKVIGKKGQTVQALRTILHAASAKADKRAVLEIIEWFSTNRETNGLQFQNLISPKR